MPVALLFLSLPELLSGLAVYLLLWHRLEPAIVFLGGRLRRAAVPREVLCWRVQPASQVLYAEDVLSYALPMQPSCIALHPPGTWSARSTHIARIHTCAHIYSVSTSRHRHAGARLSTRTIGRQPARVRTLAQGRQEYPRQLLGHALINCGYGGDVASLPRRRCARYPLGVGTRLCRSGSPVQRNSQGASR